VFYAGFNPDGTKVVTAGEDKVAHVWSLAPDPRPLSDLTRIAELLSGHRLAADVIVPLSVQEIDVRWEYVGKSICAP
jgi:hypothetical protein